MLCFLKKYISYVLFAKISQMFGRPFFPSAMFDATWKDYLHFSQLVQFCFI